MEHKKPDEAILVVKVYEKKNLKNEILNIAYRQVYSSKDSKILINL